MGIYDRDYMREDDPADWWKPGYSIKRWLTIGPAKARLIAANRPYQNIDDLGKLHGIGAKLTNDLHLFIKTDGVTEKVATR